MYHRFQADINGQLFEYHMIRCDADNKLTYEDVKQLVNKQHNQQIRPFNSYNSGVAPYARFEYQIDIMDMNNLKSEYIYTIIVIYAFSKLADAEPMKR